MGVMRQRSKNEFRPSKLLIESQDELGAMYHHARLLECPQNAIELKKLLTKYGELSKQYSKRVSEVRRVQHVLRHSLAAYLKDKQPDRIDEAVQSSVSNEHISTGFRFHSDGQSKSVTSGFTDLSSSSGIEAGGSSGEHVDTISRHLLPSCQKEIEETEALLKNIRLDLSKNGIEWDSLAQNCRISFLRSHARDNSKSSHKEGDQMKPSRHPNDRFAFQPGSRHFGHTSERASFASDVCKKRTCIRPNCTACNFNLKCSLSDFSPRLNKIISEVPRLRWKAAPRNKYMKMPLSKTEINDFLKSESSSARIASSLSSKCVPLRRSATAPLPRASSKDLTTSQLWRPVSSCPTLPESPSGNGSISSKQNRSIGSVVSTDKNSSRAKTGSAVGIKPRATAYSTFRTCRSTQGNIEPKVGNGQARVISNSTLTKQRFQDSERRRTAAHKQSSGQKMTSYKVPLPPGVRSMSAMAFQSPPSSKMNISLEVRPLSATDFASRFASRAERRRSSMDHWKTVLSQQSTTCSEKIKQFIGKLDDRRISESAAKPVRRMSSRGVCWS